ncbi:MAG: D-tyrosyl-tRNA(Tyr) deacylase [Bacteroidia bacterium]|nr:D-tyrosyl-tRNA(Tyr) deacylase [Bacteroidia bacterium]
MRLVIQRVTQAALSINNNPYSSINKGLMVLVGFEEKDTLDDVKWAAKKLINLRVFSDNEEKMNLSVLEINGELLLVSQFTLHAQTKKGNRPSFISAAKPDKAIPLYNEFIKQCETLLPNKIKTGLFGADMQITLTNNGPVTIIIDTQNKE